MVNLALSLCIALVTSTRASAVSPFEIRTVILPCEELLHPEKSRDFKPAIDRWFEERFAEHLTDRRPWTFTSKYLHGPTLVDRVRRVLDVSAVFRALSFSRTQTGPAPELPEVEWQARLSRGPLSLVIDYVEFYERDWVVRHAELLIELPATAVNLTEFTDGVPVHAMPVKGDRLLFALDLDEPLATRVAKTLETLDRLSRPSAEPR